MNWHDVREILLGLLFLAVIIAGFWLFGHFLDFVDTH